jgi:hypothetical protein
LSRIHAIDNAKVGGRLPRSAYRVGGDEGVPVHRGSREGRYIDASYHIGRGNAASRLVQTDARRSRDRSYRCRKPAARFLESDGRRKRAHVFRLPD